MSKTILVKENSITKEIPFSKEEHKKIKTERNHLCRNCTYCTPLDCKKVKDETKDSIDNYDFIIDGKEVFDEDGTVENLTVTNCSNFKEMEKRERRSIKEANRAKRLLKVLFYNAIDYEDACRTQEYRKQIREGNFKEAEKAKVLTKRYK